MKDTPRHFTTTASFWSFMALAVGLVLGIWGFESGSPWIAALARAVQPLGVIWLNALRMTVLPLVVMQLLTAITGGGDGDSVGAAGRRAVGLILIMLFSGAGLAYLISVPLVGLISVPPETVEAIRESVLVPMSAQAAGVASPTSLGDWLVSLVPSNLLDAAVRGDLIQILLVTMVFGLAVNKLPSKEREPLANLFRVGSNAIMIVIQWILVATPVGVFALVIALALGTGSESVGLLGAYLLLNQSVLLFFILLLYPVTAFFGRVPVRQFARAAMKPQIIGLSTRSSIASMPAQIENGREFLGFSSTTSGFVVPLLVSTFKFQSPIQNGFRVLFLAHIFGMHLTFTQYLSFSFAIVVISVTTLGVPVGGSRLKSLPAYAASGVPLEGLVFIQAIQDLADYVYTLANVTAQLAAATILSRKDRLPKGS